MDRRNFLIVTAAALAGPALAEVDRGRPLDLEAAARTAWLYGLPLIEMATTRGQAARRAGGSVDRFVHARKLAGPDDRAVTGPNNDTLYSSAWIDLAAGPVTLNLPATGERYFSLHLLDMYTNTVAVLGSRTTGGSGGPVVLVGPDAAPPPGAIRAATPWVWAIGRTLVDGPADLAAANAVQDQLTIAAPAAGRAPPTYAGRDAAWPEYFAAVQALIAENPPPATDRALFGRISGLGLGPRGGFDAARFTPAQAAEIAAGVAQARDGIGKGAHGRLVGGWAWPDEKLGDFGQDYDYRAAVALGGLGALVPAEAMYIRPLDPGHGDLFDGDGLWRVHLPDGGPPVDAFWSLTMYESLPTGQHFLTRNPIGRYAIGDRTPGLKINADRSLDIWISRADPGGERTANWLPAPASGPFMMTLRAYLPRPAMIDGEYHLPPVEKV